MSRGVLLLVLGHVDADHGALVVEERLGQRPGQLGLADAGGPEEDEAADGPVGILQAGAGPHDRLGHRLDRLVLADDAPVQGLLEMQQLLHLALEQLAHRDAGPAADDLGDVFLVHFLFQQPRAGLGLFELLLGLGQLLLELGELAVLQLGGPVQVVLALGALDLDLDLLDLLAQGAQLLDVLLLGAPAGLEGLRLLLEIGQLLLELGETLLGSLVGLLLQGLALDLELHDAAVDLIEFARHRVDLGAQLGRRLIDQVDGLVRQETIGDVAVREHRGGHQGRILDPHPVVDLVALLQAAQDRDGVLDRRLIDHHRLEAALQRGVLLDVFAVFVEGGSADAVQLAPGQHRLEQVAGVHGALGLAGSDDGVQLVDEQDDVPGLDHLIDQGLEALLELAPIFGPGDHGGHVQLDDLLPQEGGGHVPGGDPLGQALDDRRLAHAGLPDDRGVVLLAAA